MKLRMLIALGLLSGTPSHLQAQSETAPPPAAIATTPRTARPAKAGRTTAMPAPVLAAVVPQAPGAARSARAATLPAPAIAMEAAVPVPFSPEETQPAPAPKMPVAPGAALTTVTPPAPAAPAPPRPLGQLLNVQIEVTLSDSKGMPKTVVLTVADGEMGQNRTGSDVLLTPNGSYKQFGFNADARPNITGNKIRLFLSAEATVPASDAKAGSAANISLRQSQTLILNDGDSVEIARATDPVSERAFALSVRVKIQR